MNGSRGLFRRVALLAVLGLVVGLVSAVAAVGFVEAVFWLNDRLVISPRSRMLLTDPVLLTTLTLAVPAAGGLLVGLLCRWIPGERAHGPPDAIRAAQSLEPTIPARTGILSALAAALSLGAGASAGLYGPLAHMGASLGAWFSRIAGESRYFGTIGIGCGVSAAISAAFNAPIAGLVFAHEVVLRHYSLRAFAPITVAATMGYVVANVVFERPPLFRIEQVGVANAYEYLAFIGLGISGAIIAMFYMRAVLFAGRMYNWLRIPGPLKTALAGLALGVVALELPDVLGMGKEVLRFAIIDDAFSAPELALTLLAKLLLTALCIGFGFAGGVFLPALVVGVLFGALVGTGAEWAFGYHHSHIAIYAVCGMVAVTSPVIGAPLTAILIVFELTRNYDLTTAAMVSVAFANLLGYRIFGRSLFDAQLLSRGFDLSLGRDKVIVQQRLVGDLLSDEFTQIRSSDSISETRDALVRERHGEAYVMDSEGRFLGTVSALQLMQLAAMNVDPESPIAPHVVAVTFTLNPEDSIWEAMTKIRDFVGERIPVVSEGRLLGVVFEASIVSAYLKILGDIREEENAAA